MAASPLHIFLLNSAHIHLLTAKGLGVLKQLAWKELQPQRVTAGNSFCPDANPSREKKHPSSQSTCLLVVVRLLVFNPCRHQARAHPLDYVPSPNFIFQVIFTLVISLHFLHYHYLFYFITLIHLFCMCVSMEYASWCKCGGQQTTFCVCPLLLPGRPWGSDSGCCT